MAKRKEEEGEDKYPRIDIVAKQYIVQVIYQTLSLYLFLLTLPAYPSHKSVLVALDEGSEIVGIDSTDAGSTVKHKLEGGGKSAEEVEGVVYADDPSGDTIPSSVSASRVDPGRGG
jgi:hypothetical protein